MKMVIDVKAKGEMREAAFFMKTIAKGWDRTFLMKLKPLSTR
jgi:hypothetical protein